MSTACSTPPLAALSQSLYLLLSMDWILPWKSEIDTSAALSLMNEHTYRSLNGSPPSIRLKTYTGVHVMFCIKHSRLIWISLLSLAKDALC